MLSAASSSVRMVSTKGMASLTVAMTTSTCSRQNAAAAVSLSWRTTSQHSTHNGIQIASSARSVSPSLQQVSFQLAVKQVNW